MIKKDGSLVSNDDRRGYEEKGRGDKGMGKGKGERKRREREGGGKSKLGKVQF